MPCISKALARAVMILLALSPATRAPAVTLAAHSVAGLMQQPTSQYYHLVYGATLETATDLEGILGRLTYIERPQFTAMGFADQETFAMASIGTKLTKDKNHGLYAFVGGGQASGYIKPSSDATHYTEQRDFQMRSATFSIEYGWQWRHLFASASHMTMIGIVDKAQSDIRVAWPYQFFLINIGMRL